MDHLDGNAIGGMLLDVFGSEMTTATGVCGTCGAANPVARLYVYLAAPGTVVRCPCCGSVVMVVVRKEGVACVDMMGMASMARAAG